ncbi:DUF1345 domain-containing protein [Schlesneria sp.]|uniref:DUF1345 domain-containing protein n=1 Tax=Schlesneria sp. TaxID=2762018 RepID=UPI002EED2DDF
MSPWKVILGRMVFAALIGLSAFAVSTALEIESRILLGFDLAVTSYIVTLVWRMAAADATSTREDAARIEFNNVVVLLVAGLLSGLSLVGVGLMLHRSVNWSPAMTNLHLGLSLAAVFLTWGLLHLLFGIHYARLYYDPTPPADEPADRPPLEFPDDTMPDFWDFMYFSFTLAICYQVSDISVRSRRCRRVVLAHVLLSFLNVTFILGFVIEIIGTFISPTT